MVYIFVRDNFLQPCGREATYSEKVVADEKDGKEANMLVVVLLVELSHQHQKFVSFLSDIDWTS